MTEETHHDCKRGGTCLSRRHAIAGVGALAAAPLLAACGGGEEATSTAPASSAPTSAAPTSAAPTTAAPSAAASSAGEAAAGFTTTADVPVGSGAIFADESVVVTQPTAGEFKGFSNICTHEDCPVTEISGAEIVCTCHQSHFSITDGSVLAGPAETPLPEVAITVTGDQISKA